MSRLHSAPWCALGFRAMLSRCALMVLALLGVVPVRANDWTCKPLQMGVLTNWKDRTQCLDVADYDGRGDVATFLCDGYQDQIWVICEDGTVRNAHSQFCLDISDHSGSGNIDTAECELFPSIATDQQWRVVDGMTVKDSSGWEQYIFRLQSVMSGLCLDVADYDGSGNVATYRCEEYPKAADQWFYFRNRGAVVASGHLVNAKSGACMDVSNYGGHGDVATYNCENRNDQVFTLYENGEIIDLQSQQCLDVSYYSGSGNIDIAPCEDAPDQKWTRTLCSSSACNGTFSLVDGENQCVDVAGYDGKGEIATHQCTDEDDQKWSFKPSTWMTPIGEWASVWCNQDGSISETVTASVTQGSTREISESTTISVSAEISEGFIFEGAKITSTVSDSLSNTWSTSTETSRAVSVLVTCDKYDDGREFDGGCLWQWNMHMASISEAGVDWASSMTACTSTVRPPRCPPFTRCADDACNYCVDMLRQQAGFRTASPVSLLI